MKFIHLTKIGLGGLAGLAWSLAGTVTAENWPTWRGPAANGVAPGGNPPTEFSESKNVQWKTKVPGSGSSTPVIWGDQVFVLTAEKTGKKVAAAAGGEGRAGGGDDSLDAAVRAGRRRAVYLFPILMTHETKPTPDDSAAVQLSARQWLCALGLSLGFAWLLPEAWTAFESLAPVPHYRVPYELSNDYWLYERWLDQLPPDAIPVVGDSVVWGEYTAHDGTLSRFLGAATGKPFANAGINGLYPLALWGLVEHHGGALANRRVLLHCNLLWMSDPEADMQLAKEQVFNHPALVPQFTPRIPCYRADTDTRLGRALERWLEPLSWVRHFQQTYFGQKSASEWTLGDDGKFPPTYPNTYRLPVGVPLSA